MLWRVCLAAFLTLCIATFAINAPRAQFNGCQAGFCTKSAGFTASCTQSSNFLGRATNVTSNTDKTNYDTLICGLVNDSYSGGGTLFAALDALWVLAAPDSTTAGLNLLGTSFSTLTPTNSPTFTASLGYAGNGSNAYVLTNLTLGSGTAFAQNSGSYGACDMTSSTSTGIDALMGAQDTTDGTFSDLIPMVSASSALARINQQGGSSQSGTNANRLGFYTSVVTGSTTQQLYKQTTNIGSNGGSTHSIAGGYPALTFLARNDGGTPASFTSDTIGAAFVGNQLNATDESNLRGLFNTFMTAYGHSC